MNKSKKSQFAIEFVILITLMLTIFLGFFAVISYRTSEFEESKKQQTAGNIAALVDNEIKLAKLVNDGYEITFKIPKRINGNIYTIELIDNRELVVTYLGYEHVLFLPENVQGDIGTGLNEIKKIGNILLISNIEPSS